MSIRPDSRRRRRMLTAFTVFAVLLGGVFTIAAVARGDDDDRVVLDVQPAVAAVIPSTIAPRSDPTDRPITTNTSTTLVAPPMSPLAELVGPTYSVIPEPVSPTALPVRMQISTIDVDRYPIRAVGLQADGQLEIPDETEIGWYRFGSTPGRPGATVFAAHVSWNRTTGPFARLGSVEPGDQISVALDDDTTRHYEVTERAIYGKLELPRDRIWNTTGDESLVLITCGGDYNPEVRRYAQNIVVYAVPVA